MPSTLIVSEIFGPTFQGEGKNIGVNTMFLRLMKCNLTCTWCDTAYTWDTRGLLGVKYKVAPSMKMTINDIVNRLNNPNHLVITGGEPLLQQEGIIQLINLLPNCEIEIETNGTIYPKDDLNNVQFNVSPKLSNSQYIKSSTLNEKKIKHFDMLNTTFKFVIDDIEDIAEVINLRESMDLRSPIFLMPQCRDSQTQLNKLRLIEQMALDNNFNLSPRLHILLHEDKRGI